MHIAIGQIICEIVEKNFFFIKYVDCKKIKSSWHWNFANRDIKKGEKVIRYIGDKISKSEGDRRSALRIKNFLNSEKTGSVYIFELNKKYDIDGNVKRNKARYINHSCDPNCEVEIENNEIWISSIRKIKKRF